MSCKLSIGSDMKAMSMSISDNVSKTKSSGGHPSYRDKLIAGECHPSLLGEVNIIFNASRGPSKQARRIQPTRERDIRRGISSSAFFLHYIRSQKN
jgi:hypothetical protein